MTRFKVLFALVALLSLIGIGAGAVSKSTLSGGVTAQQNCCDDPTCSPGCCPDCPPDCCPTALLAETQGFTCPLTGEELPSASCCPLSSESARASTKTACPSCPLCP